jgi:hypothetical protein
VLKLLHAHHEGEDLTIYPSMLERLPEHAEVLEAVNAEHESELSATAFAHFRGHRGWRSG